MSASEKPAGEGATHTAEQLEKARAEARADGVKAGAEAERTRIKAIVSHADAQGRSEMASHLAFETSMDADAAVALLGKSPKVAAAGKDKSPLEAAMAAAGTPGIVADDTEPGAAKVGAWDATVKKLGGK